MKKIYLFILGSFLIYKTDAQITLTQTANTPVVGNSFTYITNNAATIPVPQAGANQTWDFSTVGGTATPINYINLSSSQEPLTFPTANVVESSAGAESYYNSSSSSYNLMGQFIPGSARLIFTDPRELIKFPVTYLDVFNETFGGTMENIAASQTYDRAGTISMKADGYGTLILPYGTINNVLKIVNTTAYTDEFSGFPIASYVDTVTFFFNATTNNWIASNSVLYINGFLSLNQTTYMSQSDIVLGVDDFIPNTNQVNIYPNPAKNQITIASNAQLENITIFDLTGKVVKDVVSSYLLTQKVDLSDLSEGVYFIKYTDTSGTYTRKLILE